MIAHFIKYLIIILQSVVIKNIFEVHPFGHFTIHKDDFPQLILWHFNTWYHSEVLKNLVEINSIHSLVEQFFPTVLKASCDEYAQFYSNHKKVALQGDQIIKGIGNNC